MSAYLGALLIAFAIALGSIWANWERYWPMARSLRRQLATCPTSRELRFTIINVEVERTSAVIHRPLFKRATLNRERPGLPARIGLRAA